MIGITKDGSAPTTFPGGDANSYGYHSNGNKYNNGTPTSYGASYTTNDVIRIELDLDNGTLVFFKNGTSQGTAYSGLSGSFTFCGRTDATGQAWNFGQKPTSGTPNTGFLALCSTNMPQSAVTIPSEEFQVVLDTGPNIKSTAEALFTYELEWIKDRANSNNHQLLNSVTGSGVLQSNSTGAETTYSAPSGNSVGWVWRLPNAGVSNTAGSITSTVSANTEAGISVGTFTMAGSGTVTVGHGLSDAPALIIGKNKEVAGYNWMVYHKSLGNTKRLLLNTTAAEAVDSYAWADTTPTSSVFSTKVGGWADDTHDCLFIAFAEIEGFSKFGSYVGTGATPNFVYCGFRPRYVMFKIANGGSGKWYIHDTARDTYNLSVYKLTADTSAYENDPAVIGNAGEYDIDIVSNGFSHRTTNAGANGNGYTFIFWAMADMSVAANANAR
jgi:hypothetical protein